MLRLRHPHIIQFVFVSHDPDGGLILISELMGGGSLSSWLYKRKHTFPASTQVRLSYQIAAGTRSRSAIVR